MANVFRTTRVLSPDCSFSLELQLTKLARNLLVENSCLPFPLPEFAVFHREASELRIVSVG